MWYIKLFAALIFAASPVLYVGYNIFNEQKIHDYIVNSTYPGIDSQKVFQSPTLETEVPSSNVVTQTCDCGGKSYTGDVCSFATCCQVGEVWEVYPSNESCIQAQQAIASNQTNSQEYANFLRQRRELMEDYMDSYRSDMEKISSSFQDSVNDVMSDKYNPGEISPQNPNIDLNVSNGPSIGVSNEPCLPPARISGGYLNPGNLKPCD